MRTLTYLLAAAVLWAVAATGPAISETPPEPSLSASARTGTGPAAPPNAAPVALGR